MNIGLFTQYTPNFDSMAEITIPGRKEYAQKHDYTCFIDRSEWVKKDIGLGQDKCLYMANLMKENPSIEWFWWLGCDALITNHNIKLETLIDNNFEFIVTKDNHGICADSFLIKNSKVGIKYLEHLAEFHPMGSEQAHMWDDTRNPTWSSVSKYLPQNTMNSYNLKYYPHKGPVDVFGQRSNWESGDFVLHAITGLLTHMTIEQIYDWKMTILTEAQDKVIK